MITPDWLPSAAAFEKRFGAAPQLAVRVPGRVNLIGDHTDYHEGFVLPMAINRGITLLARPRADSVVRVYSETLDASVKVDLDQRERHPERWAQYLQGVIAVFGARYPLHRGCDVLITGDLPPGGGLSSSSALVVGFIALLGQVQEVELAPLDCATLGRDAEHWYGTSGGIMDQFVISHGRAGKAVLLDCRALSYELISIPADVTVVIAHTGTRHNQIVSPFAERRRQAEAALEVARSIAPEIKTLRDIDPASLGRFRDALEAADPDGVLWRRCTHVVTENARVRAAASALAQGDVRAAGKLMGESHASLRNDYEVSSPELDAMVEAALEDPACHGARMTGGGFGGCTVNLVGSQAVDDFCEGVKTRYAAATGIQATIFSAVPSDGVQAVRLPSGGDWRANAG
jgi:galactokinase